MRAKAIRRVMGPLSTTIRILAPGAATLLLASCSGDPYNPMPGTGSTSAPVITVSPSNVTVSAGQFATFSVSATGATPLSYQWTRTGVDIAGATTATYSFTATAADNGASFAVTVSNAFGTVTSQGATLTVQ